GRRRQCRCGWRGRVEQARAVSGWWMCRCHRRKRALQGVWQEPRSRLDSGHAMTRATIVGAGGLGGPLALSLGAAGLELTIVDPDVVDESNLHRQIQFSGGDVGKPKAPLLAAQV